MVMTREDFIAILTPDRARWVYETVQGGLADYANPENYSAAARLDHTKSIRAAIRNGHMIGRGKRALVANPGLGIRHVRKGGRDLFYLADKARIALKLLDRNLRHHNYPTQQAGLFDGQRWPDDAAEVMAEAASEIARQTGDEGSASAPFQAMSLWPSDVVLEMTNVVAGYVANAAETDFEVHIICPDGAGNAWTLKLTGAEIIEFITAPAAAAAKAAKRVQRRRVQLRPGAQKKQGTTDGSVG